MSNLKALDRSKKEDYQEESRIFWRTRTRLFWGTRTLSPLCPCRKTPSKTKIKLLNVLLTKLISLKAKGNLSLSPRIVNSDRQETQVAAPNTKSRIESKVSFENVKSKAFEKTKKCAKRRRGQVTLKTAKVPQIAGKTVVARCLKITEKVSFNIASEASYVYILSGQKLIKNAKNGPFWRVFENLKLAVKQCYQTGQF